MALEVILILLFIADRPKGGLVSIVLTLGIPIAILAFIFTMMSRKCQVPWTTGGVGNCVGGNCPPQVGNCANGQCW